MDTVFISLYTGSAGKPDFVSIAGIQISHFGGASCREKLVDELARRKAMEKVMEHGVLITIAFSSIDSSLVKMSLQIIFGVVIYLLLSFVTKNKEFYFILNIIKTLINKKTSK